MFLWECFYSSQVKLVELCRKSYVQCVTYRQSKLEGAEPCIRECLPRKWCFNWHTTVINVTPVFFLQEKETLISFAFFGTPTRGADSFKCILFTLNFPKMKVITFLHKTLNKYIGACQMWRGNDYDTGYDRNDTLFISIH